MRFVVTLVGSVEAVNPLELLYIPDATALPISSSFTTEYGFCGGSVTFRRPRSSYRKLVVRAPVAESWMYAVVLVTSDSPPADPPS